MSYSTHYTLKAEPWPEQLGDIISRHDWMSLVMDEGGNPEEPRSWYDHEDHMRKLSRRFPAVHFTLKGEGEESGDVWEKHFVDGRMQVCQARLVMPRFNPAKLK